MFQIVGLGLRFPGTSPYVIPCEITSRTYHFLSLSAMARNSSFPPSFNSELFQPNSVTRSKDKLFG